MGESMVNGVPKHVVIVGGGTAGWMTANLVAHHWAKLGTRVSLIESTKIPTVGVGEGSTPYLKEFFDTLGISESEWMQQCNATYKCGIRFPNWSTKQGYQSYFHPFYSDNDSPLAKQFFDMCNSNRKGRSVLTRPDDFFIAAALARHRKAPIHIDQHNPDAVYAYHFDAELLGQFLKQHALQMGVNHIDDKVTEVVNQQNGNIAILQTQKHGPLRGDLFFDCSGFRGLLIQQNLGERVTSYSDQLFNNSAIAIQTPYCQSTEVASDTLSEALSAGWAWKIPLQNRFGNGYVYSSDYLTKNQAEQELREFLGVEANDQDAVHLKWTPGRISQHWKNNCMAIGLAQGFLEPLEAPMLFIVQKSIERFISCFTEGDFTDKYQRSLNHEINNMIDGTRDYLQAHYKLNSRTDSQYWRDNRENTHLSSTLTAILTTWSSTENFDQCLATHAASLAYLKTSWYCLLAGKGYFSNLTDQIPQTVSMTLNARVCCDQSAQSYPSQRQKLDSMTQSYISTDSLQG
jgi:hypothetical protein